MMLWTSLQRNIDMFLKVVLLLLVSIPTYASEHNEAWTMFLTQKKWGDQKQYGIAAFSTPRYSFKSDQLYQNLIGFTALHKISSDFELGLGYLHDVNKDFGLKEKRPFLDMSFRRNFQYGKMWLRNRLEYRIYQSIKDENFRYRLMGRFDFNIIWTKMNLHPFLSDELLIRLKDQNWSNQLGITQNRFFAGIRKNFENKVSLDLSLLIFVNQRSSAQDRFILGPALNFFYWI